MLADPENVERLHAQNDNDYDLYELVQYVKSDGRTVVTPKETIWLTQSKYAVYKEVAISQVFQDNIGYERLFYTGRFDFVVYEKQKDQEIPLLAIELDGKEHLEDEVVRRRDAQKNKICREHDLQLIRVENTYARRYNFIKSILMSYFATKWTKGPRTNSLVRQPP